VKPLFQGFTPASAQLCSSAVIRETMAKVKLGSKEFDADSCEIDASECKVTDADCAAFGMRMKGGEFAKLTAVNLVSFFWFCFRFGYFSALNLYRTTTKLETPALVL
jgi:hypothetical protein